MGRLRKFAPYFILAIISVIAIGWLISRFVSSIDTKWDQDEIEEYLGIEIPEDATDISYAGHRGYGGFLHLQFRSSLDDVTYFTKQICPDGLHAGFDPFNAIKTGGSAEDSILIKGWRIVYYAYSEDTPDSLLGIRCQSDTGMLTQITAEPTNINSYELRLEIPDYNEHFDFLDNPMSRHSMPIQGSGFPLMVIGITERDGVYVQARDEVCLEAFKPGFFLGWGYYKEDDLTPFFGSTLEFDVDGIRLPSATIDKSGNGGIKPLEITDERVDVPIHRLWQYCFFPEWESGDHTMNIKVTTATGEVFEYSWDFRVPDTDELNTCDEADCLPSFVSSIEIVDQYGQFDERGICFELDQSEFWVRWDTFQQPSVSLVEQIKVSIDETPISNLNLTFEYPTMVIITDVLDDTGESIGWYPDPITVCYGIGLLEPGTHTTYIEIETISGAEYSFSWMFDL